MSIQFFVGLSVHGMICSKVVSLQGKVNKFDDDSQQLCVEPHKSGILN
jgi:hypothetical protein